MIWRDPLYRLTSVSQEKLKNTTKVLETECQRLDEELSFRKPIKEMLTYT